MNISITTDCNRRCEYCFQKEWYLSRKIHQDVREMPVETFSRLIDWLCRAPQIISRETPIQILGGEPFLYSKIEQIFEVLKKRCIDVTWISNISTDPEKFKDVIIPNIANRMITRDLLINTDYPKAQREVFLRNYEEICKTPTQFGLSTTLLPSQKATMEAAERIQELIEIYKTHHNGTFDPRYIRLAPSCPNPADIKQYQFFDFSENIADFIDAIWNKCGKVNVNFDCPTNYCELSIRAVDVLREAGVWVNVGDCNKCGAFDILVDNSVIWCSSSNFIKLNDWRDFPTFEQAQDALHGEWEKYWRGTTLQCDYKNCDKFNPVFCHGVCVAKNHFLQQIREKANTKEIPIKAI